tara:strand:- start:1338 stop:1718 length:381 start_codon:yes stop_codon:yes gene_type:complete
VKPGEINKLQIKAILETIFGPERVELEWRFHPVRRWRFDYAVPEIKLAVEYAGHAGFIGKGVSGHSTIKGLTNDSEKANSAIAHGWRVLQFTALHFTYKDQVKHKLTPVRETIMNTLSTMQNEIEK